MLRASGAASRHNLSTLGLHFIYQFSGHCSTCALSPIPFETLTLTMAYNQMHQAWSSPDCFPTACHSVDTCSSHIVRGDACCYHYRGASMITGPQSREGSRGSDWKGPGQARTWCRGFQSRASGTNPAASCTRCTTSPARSTKRFQMLRQASSMHALENDTCRQLNTDILSSHTKPLSCMAQCISRCQHDKWEAHVQSRSKRLHCPQVILANIAGGPQISKHERHQAPGVPGAAVAGRHRTGLHIQDAEAGQLVEVADVAAVGGEGQVVDFVVHAGKGAHAHHVLHIPQCNASVRAARGQIPDATHQHNTSWDETLSSAFLTDPIGTARVRGITLRQQGGFRTA